MDQQHFTRLTSMIALTEVPCEGIPAPAGFDPRPGEKVLWLLENVELLELRKTEPPLTGGTSDVGYAAAQAMAAPGAVHRRSLQLGEAVTTRSVGSLVVTDRRAVALGAGSSREWSFDQLRAMTHDLAVPETWLWVRNRKRLSGIRYPAVKALELRFWLALGIATARDDRPALAASLTAEAEPYRALPEAVVVSGTPRPVRVLKRIYFGKPGGALPARVAQGALAGVLTLGLFGALLPHQGDDTSALTAANARSAAGATTQARLVGPGPDSDVRATAQQAADAAAAQQRAVADQAAASQAAAERAAADKVAADDLAAKAAADQAAALATAAEQAAAAQRTADKAAADKAATDKATAERAAAARAATAPVANQPASPSGSNCTPAYPDFCIPLRTGDAYNCPDFAVKGFTALAPDPYRLDRDRDGIACES